MTEQLTVNQELLHFIGQCPDAFHTIAILSQKLEAIGYIPLAEQESWELHAGGKYFVTRNQSSILAFRIPEGDWRGFMMTASHSDTPCFKLKPAPLMTEGSYLKLNTEPYGGMIAESWLDRPLSLSGRVLVATKSGIAAQLLHIDRDLLSIPNLAPHMKNSADKERSLNPQTDLLPLLGMADNGEFVGFLADELGVAPDAILDYDLFLYCRQAGSIWGKNHEFVSSPRLDDLLCVFACLQGFVHESHPGILPVFAVFDNEEVGSGTKQGAKSGFLYDTLNRICRSLGKEYATCLSGSFLLSCDNGHALHPNRTEKADPTNRPLLNGGVLLKYNANQRYTTDGVSASILRQICKQAEIPLQTYVNRSDIPGGSTLGNLACEKVSVNSADVGVAQLSMHSAWETAGTKDTQYLLDAIKAFYRTAITPETDGSYLLDIR